VISITTVWGGLFWIAITVKDDRSVVTARGLTRGSAERRLIFDKLSE
jgi:hypothetical protein